MYFYKLREDFLNFFKERGHTIVPSSSLIPDDPSVLLTTAGMQQFKRYYTGELNPFSDFGSARTASIQKCFRTSDIEEVGDNTHLTFFEMLGNFSFGPVGEDDPKNFGKEGYFKRAAIGWGFELVTQVLKIDPAKIFVTVFGGDKEIPFDEESFKIWSQEIGLPKERIKLGSREDNFWGPTGSEGPCGPTTEIYVASDENQALQGKGVEVWNIVFNEFYKNKSGEYKKLENPGIDTGAGYERLLTVLERVESVFETSAFLPLVEVIKKMAPSLSLKELRVLADHIRGAIFLIADGVEPSNKEAGYVLRRLLRRIIAIKVKNDIHEDIFQLGYEEVKKLFGDIYPEVKDKEKIINVWQTEFFKFETAISRGIKELTKYQTISGKDAFYLYETFGLPFELIKELAPPQAVKNLSFQDFEEEFKKHQEISRAGVQKKFGGHGLILDTGELKAETQEDLKKVLALHTATHLLQWALRKVLGDQIRQMGSDINPERLRFDFNFDRKLTEEELKKIEDLVNEQIKKDLPVYFKEMPKKEAEKIALSFFKEKYPDIVKVYFIGSEESGGVISAEFCGGPHVNSTKEIGSFKIIKEESVGKGVRRIRATVEF